MKILLLKISIQYSPITSYLFFIQCSTHPTRDIITYVHTSVHMCVLYKKYTHVALWKLAIVDTAALREDALAILPFDKLRTSRNAKASRHHQRAINIQDELSLNIITPIDEWNAHPA